MSLPTISEKRETISFPRVSGDEPGEELASWMTY